MKKTKAKVAAPMSIKDFADDVLNFVKTDAKKEDVTLIKSEIKEMIEMLEKWKDGQKVTTNL